VGVQTEAPPPQKQRVTFSLLWLVFFFHGMSPGFWIPALTNILRAEGLGEWVAMAFMVPPLCMLISPLIGGALADQRVAADKLFAWCSLLGAVALVAAFGCLDAGWHPWWFIALLGLYALILAPTWGLLTTITLTHLPHGERQFPLVRLGATIGWMAAGFILSYVMMADSSPVAGYASGVARVLAGLCAFMLPFTPPLGSVGSWKSAMGFDAFSLLKQRDNLVFFAVTAFFSVPLSAFYMYSPEHLKMLGDEHPTATMTIAQWSEIAGMLLVGMAMTRFRVKTLLLWALGLSAARFGLSAYAGASGVIIWHIMGIALHGICYTLYFITAQVFMDRRVERGMKGQAQGLLSLVSSGIGPLVGAVFCGWLRGVCVTPDGQGWDKFWMVLAGMIFICLAVFALFYRGLNAEAAEKI